MQSRTSLPEAYDIPNEIDFFSQDDLVGEK